MRRKKPCTTATIGEDQGHLFNPPTAPHLLAERIKDSWRQVLRRLKTHLLVERIEDGRRQVREGGPTVEHSAVAALKRVGAEAQALASDRDALHHDVVVGGATGGLGRGGGVREGEQGRRRQVRQPTIRALEERNMPSACLL